MNNTKAISFWQFLENYKIEIPIIQRDYAQGRKGKEELRRSFLTNLKEALDKEKELKLDFVYGAINNNTLTPLDGQQRLTTLWLLHWYVALRAGKLKEVCEKLKKFSYETRVSSREFCEQLCNYKNFECFQCKEDSKIVEFIINQTWFYSAWKQDPTIQSMLRMLSGTKETDKSGNDFIDGIEELFEGEKTTNFGPYWEKLSKKDCPITFYHLPLENFGLSDDLYIKMNARGKQLTDFENLKADLIGYIQENKWEIQNDIAIKFDTTWTDLFWENRKGKGSDKDKGEIDDIYFAFLNRFFWNELFIAKNKNNYILDIGKGDETSTQENNNVSYKYLNEIDEKIEKNNNTERFYQGLDKYKYFDRGIPLVCFEKLRKVLDNYISYKKDNKDYECSWNKNFSFIPKYKDDKILELNQRERIVFYAICKYFDHDTNIQDTKESFDRWMRVIWNLVSGEDNSGKPNIRSTSAMRNAIEFIEKLDSHDVYSSLRDLKEQVIVKSEFDERCKEEIEKADKIKEDNNWEKIIIEAEKSLFFKGTIRFLFRNDKGNWDWDNFVAKLENATKYFFNTEGINDIYKIELTRKLVFQCDNGNKIYDKQIFNPNASTWLWILSSKDYQDAVHNILLGKDIKNPSEKIALNGIKIDLNNLPYEKMIKDIPNGRFRCSWGKLGYYEPYKQTAIVYNPELSECFEKLENIQLANEVNLGNGYFYGWDIKFKYNDNEYEWKRDNNVCLKDNETITFKVDDNINKDNFIENLKNLMEF